MSGPRMITKGVLALFTVYLVWGSTYLGIRIAIQTIPPLTMAGTRFLVAGLILLTYCAVRKTGYPTWRQWRDASIIGASLVLVGNGGVTVAERYIPSGAAALIVATVPLFLTLLAWCTALGPRPSVSVTTGLILGFGGVGVLSSSSSMASMNSSNWHIGVWIVLTASIVWAAGSLYTRRASKPASSVLAVGMQMFTGGLFQCLASILFGEYHHYAIPSLASLCAWFYLVTFGAILGFSAYVYLLQVYPPAIVGTYAFVNPVVALALGAWFAQEPLDGRTAGGATAIILAVLMISFGRSLKSSDKRRLTNTEAIDQSCGGMINER